MARLVYRNYVRIFLQNKLACTKARSLSSILPENPQLSKKELAFNAVTAWGSRNCSIVCTNSDVLEKTIENLVKSGNASAILEKLDKADDCSLHELPKRIWGNVFYSLNQNKEFEKLDNMRAKTKKLNINCGEGAYTTLIKSYVLRKQAINAADVFDEMKNGAILRHTRTYFPIITCLAENGYQKRAFELFDEMQHRTFKSKKAIAMAIPPSMSVALIKSSIQGDIIVYQKAKDILLWYKKCGQPLTLDVMYAIEEWLNNDPLYNWTTTKCIISKDGSCDSCKQTLSSGALTSDEKETLKMDILNTIQNIFKLEKKRKKREKFVRYERFLKEITPCDVVIDGMNIGLSSNVDKRNKRFNFKALLEVLNHFVTQGKKVLVLVNTSVQTSFLSKDVEYFVSNVGDDDLYIMYACAMWSMLPFLVTRDRFREHRFLFAFHNHASYLRWIRMHSIKVSEERNTFKFHRQRYDPVVQAASGTWHFPLAGGQWFCAKQVI